VPFAAALTAQRTMASDIVATIQGKQDRIIDSEPVGVLVVQGLHGKTAVALQSAQPTCSTCTGISYAPGCSSWAARSFRSTSRRCFPKQGVKPWVVLASVDQLCTFPIVEATREAMPANAAIGTDAGLIARRPRSCPCHPHHRIST
jgi:hypothetical protein